MNSNEETSANISENSHERIYQVKVIGAILGSLVLCALGLIIGSYALLNGSGTIAIIGLAIAAISFARFRAIKDGISFDLENGVMSYPGGGVALNNLGDIINPKFMLQYFNRFSINIDEIRSMSWSMKTTTHQSKEGRISFSYTYYIDVNGKFGSSKISFGANESKRDEAYSFIRQYNRMGNPIIFT